MYFLSVCHIYKTLKGQRLPLVRHLNTIYFFTKMHRVKVRKHLLFKSYSREKKYIDFSDGPIVNVLPLLKKNHNIRVRALRYPVLDLNTQSVTQCILLWDQKGYLCIHSFSSPYTQKVFYYQSVTVKVFTGVYSKNQRHWVTIQTLMKCVFKFLPVY